MQMAPVITAEHSEEWVSKSIFETLFPFSWYDAGYYLPDE